MTSEADTIHNTDAAFMEKLRRFRDAALDLSEEWGRLNKPFSPGYPSCLPSFDDFVAEVQAWIEAIEEA